MKLYKLVGLLIFVLILTSCNHSSDKSADDDKEVTGDAFTTKMLGEIQRDIGFKLPAGTKGINALYIGNQNQKGLYFVKIEIPSECLDDLKKNIAGLNYISCSTPMPAISEPWWDFDEKSIQISKAYALFPPKERGTNHLIQVNLFLCKNDKCFLYLCMHEAI